MAEARTREAGTTLAPLTSGVMYQYCNRSWKSTLFLFSYRFLECKITAWRSVTLTLISA
jgi:hypothetical protein